MGEIKNAMRAVRERPILFSGPMVRAILDGRKTMTRRVVKAITPGVVIEETCSDHPDATVERVISQADADFGAKWMEHVGRCPYGQPGDSLWVRETWGYDWFDDGQSQAHKRVVYRADDSQSQPQDNGIPLRWTPSIHMPRRFSRLSLEITEVRVERLQEISEADAEAEGVVLSEVAPSGRRVWHASHRAAFSSLWNSLNENRVLSWDANPFVWVIGFRRSLDGAEKKE